MPRRFICAVWLVAAAAAERWAEPSARGAALLRAPPPCEFTPDAGGPLLIRDALAAATRARYEAGSLARGARGARAVQAAHPSYHVLAEGNPEGRVVLRDYIAAMRHGTASNASFAFDSTSSLVDARLAAELRAAAPRAFGGDAKAIFSLGGDGGGLGFHMHGATLLGLLHGAKLWLAVRNDTRLPPSWLEPAHAHGHRLLELVESSARGGGARDGADAAPRVLLCLQPAASAVYLPSGWWHATVNVGDAVGAALQEQRLDGVDEPGAWAAALARPADFSAAWLVRRVARAVFRSLSSTFSKKYIFVRTALPQPPPPL